LDWPSDPVGVVSAVAGSRLAVVGEVVVAVVGGAVVAVGRVVAVVDGGVVDGGVVVGVVEVGVGDVEPVERLLPEESVVPDPFGSVEPRLSPVESRPDGLLRDLWPFDDFLSDDLLSDDWLSDDWLSDEVVVALEASAGGWAAGPGTARATPPPADRPTMISSAPVPASA
jgi:hypothetical protein